MKQTRLSKVAGFTLDQTILVVAVIAILATIIISSVAWEVLSRANSTKLNAHLQQVGDAIGSYYQDDHGAGRYTWPANAADLQPYLAGYSKAGASSVNLDAPFGTSNDPSELSLNATGQLLSASGESGAGTCSTTTLDCYFTVKLTNIPAQEAVTANEAIDGAGEAAATANQIGRLRWTAGTGSALVDITYYALKK